MGRALKFDRSQRSNEGVTTAATIWYVMVIGVCFSGEQIGLGPAALALAVFVPSFLKWAERRIGRDRRRRALRGKRGDQPTRNDTGIITAAAFSGQTQPSA